MDWNVARDWFNFKLLLTSPLTYVKVSIANLKNYLIHKKINTSVI